MDDDRLDAAGAPDTPTTFDFRDIHGFFRRHLGPATE
jgi:hypothetical protein